MKSCLQCGLALVSALGLAACGGGGGGGNPPNLAPTARITAAASAETGLPVALNGSASTDPEGDALSYAWTLAARPAGSTAALAAAATVQASFVPDIAGTYLVRLTVGDGRQVSAPAEASVAATAALAAWPAGAGSLLQGPAGGPYYRVDASNGITTALAAACGSFAAMDTDPRGVVLAVSTAETRVVELDPVTGVCRTRFNTPVAMKAIAVATDGSVVTVSAVQPFGQDVIYYFSPAGTLQFSNGINVAGQGSAIQGLRVVQGIDFAPDGSVHATDVGNVQNGPSVVISGRNRVSRLDPKTGTGFLIYFTAGTLATRGDIDIDANGVMRGIDAGVLRSWTVNGWTQLSAVPLNRPELGGGALAHR